MKSQDKYLESKFPGLNAREQSDKYWTCDRVSSDKNTIIVKVADSHLLPTKYGYALILDTTHVVFLKDWQVNRNYYGNEVMLNKDYFIVKEWGQFLEFEKDEDNLKFETWRKAAFHQQNAKTKVYWQKTDGERATEKIQEQKRPKRKNK